jgi:hypothetical protein
MLISVMKKSDEQTTETARAHIRFALALHDAYSSIGASVRPMKLKPGSMSRRETLLKQIQRLKDKLDPQWYADCPSLAGEFNSIYLNQKWAKEAAKAV